MSTVQSMTLDFLEMYTPAPVESVDSIGNCLRAIKPYNLTEAENMQIVNLFPQTIVELHRIIEDITMRFTEEEIEQLLQIIKTELRETQEVKYPLPEHVDGRRDGNRNRGGRGRGNRGGRGGRGGRQGKGRRSDGAAADGAQERNDNTQQQAEPSAATTEAATQSEPKEATNTNDAGAAAGGEGSAMEVDLPVGRGRGRGRGRGARGRGRGRGKKGSEE